MKYLIITLIVTVFIGLISAFLYYENNKLDITNYTIKNKNAKNKIKIVQLSDLHSKSSRRILDKVVELNPDIICITGDYINDHEKNKEKMILFGKRLVEIAPIYYITGNHERRLENFDCLMEELKEIGFNVLLNEIAINNSFGLQIDILGLDENQASFSAYKERKKGNFQYKDMSPYFKELDKLDGFKIILSHFPENFSKIDDMKYDKYDFDLQLSGHAHGGQFCLPFIGPVFSPGQGLFPKYAKGSFGEKPMMIVSRGLGNAEFPFRLFNHPEINVINIEK